MKQLLDDAVEDFLAHRRSQDFSKRTLNNERMILKRFLTVNGNIYLHNVTGRHITRHFEEASKTRAPQSLRLDHQTLNVFFAWARQTKRMATDNDPMYGRRKPKAVQRERNRIHVSKFAHLLTVAEASAPRNRMLVAILLYTLMRDQEATDLRVGDVDLDAGFLTARIWKTRQEDRMPISAELDGELRRWLTAYAVELGRSLKPSDFLLPARKSVSVIFNENKKIVGHEYEYDPTRRMGASHRVVRPILEEMGFPTTDHLGQPLKEGAHTIRRSGARAFFDQLAANGYDHALRIVQSMLHHSSVQTTETYLGITADRRSRDEIVRGRMMYQIEEPGKVVPLTADMR